jgi:hypothetical protein
VTSPNFPLTGPATGQRIESAYLDLLEADVNALVDIIVIKALDESVSSATTGSTYQLDDELFALFPASSTWDCTLQVIYNSGATPDFKIALDTLPAGATAPSWRFEHDGGTGIATATTGIAGVPGSGADDPLMWTGVLYMGSVAGTVAWKWAQNTADAGATLVKANSIFKAHRVF